MKDTEFKKLIEGKDLSKQEDLDAIVSAINDSENSTLKRKEESFNKKYETLEASFNTLKGEKEANDKAVKESAEKIANFEKENGMLKNKAFVYKNVDHTLDDAGVNDFITLVNARRAINDKLSFEDAAKEVTEKYFGKAGKETPAPVMQEPVGVRANTGISTSLENDLSDNSAEMQRNRYDALTKSSIRKHK